MMNTYKLFLCILCIGTANNGLQATDNTVTYDLNSDGGSAAFTNDFISPRKKSVGIRSLLDVRAAV